MTNLFEAHECAGSVARRYIEAYCAKDFAGVAAVLDNDRFQFSHHSRGAYAADAESFIAMLERMAVEIFPDRRFVHVMPYTLWRMWS